MKHSWNHETVVPVYFGSESGNAQRVAKDVVKQLQGIGANARVTDLESVTVDLMKQNPLAVFVVSTTGDGAATDNAREFTEDLQGYTPDGSEYPSVAVLGLGNSAYRQYNKQGRRIDADLARIGCTMLTPLGLVDEEADAHGAIHSWIDRLIDVLCAVYPFEKKDCSCEPPVLPLGGVMGPDEKMLRRQHPNPVPESGDSPASKFYFNMLHLQVEDVHELRGRSNPGYSTCHLRLKPLPRDALRFRYISGDTLEILPANGKESVEFFMDRLCPDGEPQDLFHFVEKPEVPQEMMRPFPTPCRVRHALEHYCELHTLPNKSILSQMTWYLEDEEERGRMRRLLDSEDYQTHVIRPQISFIHFIELIMQSLKMPLADFFQLCPRLRPRAYSIASALPSNKAADRMAEVAISASWRELPPLDETVNTLKEKGYLSTGSPITRAVTREFTTIENRRTYHGVCSTFVCYDLHSGFKAGACRGVYARIKKGAMRAPADTTPIILVAVGTGLAPFRSLLQEGKIKNQGREFYLFFGCRSREEDWIYRDELVAMLGIKDWAVDDRTGEVVSGGDLHTEVEQYPSLKKLFMAFSREKENAAYVQHRLYQQRALIRDVLLKRGGRLYICGSVKMGTQLLKTLELVCAPSIPSIITPIWKTAAVAQVDILQQRGKIVSELW